MIEIRCDRCGGIIREKYYTITINEEDLNRNPELTTTASAAISAYSYSQRDLLRSLNSRPIYCESCKNEIDEFIKHKP